MATSGSTDFELDVADYIEEAFERCGLEVRTGYDLKSANRSLNLLLADWANRGLNQWTIKQRTLTLTSGTGNYDLGTDVIDILPVVVRRDGTDFQLERLSRDEYLAIPTKTTEGRPNQFFLDRQLTPKLKLWPVPENSTDVIHFDALTRIQDADDFTNTLDMPFRLPVFGRRFSLLSCPSKGLQTGFNCSKPFTKKSFNGLQQKIETDQTLTLFLIFSILG